jgi:ubiquinone/menaquinone biosynthesis C-methylase UbiE
MINKEYTKQVADEFNNWHDRGRADSMQEEHIISVEAALKEMPLKPGIKVLEIGCGNGYATRMISEKIQPGGTAYGVDISDKMIQTAIEKSKNYPGTVFKIADFSSLPFDNGTFDLVLSVESIYYAEDLLKALIEVRRTLKKAGAFFCISYFFIEHSNSSVWADFIPLKMHYLSENDYICIFKEAGFSNIKTRRILDPRPVDIKNFQPKWGYDTPDELKNFKENIGALMVTGNNVDEYRHT